MHANGKRGCARCEGVERSVNAGMLVSPQDGNRSVGETQAESACTGQPQAPEESRRSPELAPTRSSTRALALPPSSRQSLRSCPSRGCLSAWRCRAPGAVRPLRRRGAPALTAYLLAAAAPRLWAGLRCARLGCAGLRARPPRASAEPARSLGSARLGSARRCPGRLLAAHAVQGGRGAGWRRWRARLRAAPRPLGSSLFGQ